MALSSAGVVPWMVQELLWLLEVAPLGQETEIGTLPLAAAMALHKILQHSQYGPQVCLFVLELFVALIFQMVSSTSLKPLEVTAVTEDPSTPTSAIRILVKVVHKLLQCADLDRLVQAMDRHKLWRQLLGPATWQDGLRSLARVMVTECRVDSVRIFSHVQKLLWYHQLQWREVPAMVFYMELHRCLELQEENGRAEKIFRTHIHSEHSESQELAMRGLRNLYTGRMHLLLPDVLTWLQDTRADIKLQATQLLRDIVAHHPRHVQDVLSQLAVPLTSCFNEDNTELRWLSMEVFAQLLVAPGRRQLLSEVEMNLLPLFFHMNEEIPRVAQAAQEALTRAAELLRWQQLRRLARTADVWKLAECLVQKAGSAVEQYVQQSVWHLHSPQASVREAAVRFLGLLGRQLRSENPQKVQDIRKALQSVKEDGEPAVRCLVLQTLLILPELEDVPPTRPRGPALCHWLRRMCTE